MIEQHEDARYRSFCALQMSNTRAMLARPAAGSIGIFTMSRVVRAWVALGLQGGRQLDGEIGGVGDERLGVADANGGDAAGRRILVR